MSKGAKKALGIIIIIILIILVAWMIYGNATKETNNSNTLNTVQMENPEELNAVENEVQNEIVNIVENEEVVQNVEETEPEESTETNKEEDKSETQTSEVVSGDSLSREERAIQYAKEYYEEEYGSSDGVNFTNDGVREDGSFIVRSGTVEKPIYFIVNISTGEVTEK